MSRFFYKLQSYGTMKSTLLMLWSWNLYGFITSGLEKNERTIKRRCLVSTTPVIKCYSKSKPGLNITISVFEGIFMQHSLQLCNQGCITKMEKEWLGPKEKRLGNTGLEHHVWSFEAAQWHILQWFNECILKPRQQRKKTSDLPCK